MTAGEALIFFGGAPRSGLTLLRLLLDTHPMISCGPDSGVLSIARAARELQARLGALHARDFDLPPERVRANFAAAITAILDARRIARGKARAAEKTPLNVLFFADYAAMFPEARLVHVVRDGRDVAASLKERGWKDPRSGRLFDYCADAGAAARWWKGLIAEGLRAERTLGARIHRLRYEDLTGDPEATLKSLAAFLDIPYAPDMLGFHRRPPELAGMETESRGMFEQPLNAGRVGRFRHDLSAAAVGEIEKTAAAELAALGYRAVPPDGP